MKKTFKFPMIKTASVSTEDIMLSSGDAKGVLGGANGVSENMYKFSQETTEDYSFWRSRNDY